MTINEKLGKIQQEIKAPKSQYNSFGKYYYRSAEDILEAVKPFEDKYGVTFKVDEFIDSFDTADVPIVYIIAIASITDNESGDVQDARGTAIIDFDAKGMQMPQRTGSASSYAKKYAFGNLLLLDDTKDADATNKDADATNKHGKGSAPAAPKAAPKPKLKTMSKGEKEKFLKAVSEGKFSSVEKYLANYASGDNKKAVKEALTKAKSGK